MEDQREGQIINDEEGGTGGKTTIAPDVLVTIARFATLRVDGVSRMASIPATVNRLFQPGSGDGVSIDVKDEVVTLDLYVILKRDVNMLETSRLIQHEAARAISEMVGMQVGKINIHVEDVDYNSEQTQQNSLES